MCAIAVLNSVKLLKVNVNVALYKAAQDNGLGFAQSEEIRIPYGSNIYVVQDFSAGIIYVKDLDWDNFKILRKPISNPTPETLEATVIQIANQNAVIKVNMNSLPITVAGLSNLGYPRTSEYKFSCKNEVYTGQLFVSGIVAIRERDNGISIVPYK